MSFSKEERYLVASFLQAMECGDAELPAIRMVSGGEMAGQAEEWIRSTIDDGRDFFFFREHPTGEFVVMELHYANEGLRRCDRPDPPLPKLHRS